MQINQIRNIAIIAHVDHGKTTLVDQLLRQSGTFAERGNTATRLMDSNTLEKERGITILAKNTAITWGDYRINIVDTPGHADFGGEVERILSMVDSVLLLVDALDGPMPQTRFVTQKAFNYGLNPIVVVNKIDRPGARPHWVIDQVFELFDSLGANEQQLDFPVIYASALEGYAMREIDHPVDNLNVLFETIVSQVPAPNVDATGPFQMQISALDYSSFLGTIGIGRIQRGVIQRNTPVTIIGSDDKKRSGRVLQIFNFMGLGRSEVESASAGDIVAITGNEGLRISDTLCDPSEVVALPPLTVDEPTVSMTFQVNNSPFAGQEGDFVTSRQIAERLDRELIANVALRVSPGSERDKFTVSGRGELHLGILIENMRREGYELAVSRPEVVTKEINGELCEPYEQLVVDVEDTSQGAVMQELAERKGELKNMVPDGKGRVRLEYVIPTRGLIGFHARFSTMTSGSGVIYHVFDHYGPRVKHKIGMRHRGVLIANGQGMATAYSLFALQERGELCIEPGTKVYEGMIIGLHSRDNDLVVNALREKQLTNIRAAGKDDNILLVPPLRFSLEQALDFINDDELVEITPKSIRLRKRYLTENERKRKRAEHV